jgi:hypothetical protein
VGNRSDSKPCPQTIFTIHIPKQKLRQAPMQALTRTEQLTFDLCTRSCLSFWSYNNPILKNGKELCDVLVVFDKHVVIFSVKEVGLRLTSNAGDAYSRWDRKAVEESVRQIYGAEKSLRSMEYAIRADGTQGGRIPGLELRNVHRVAVACGADGVVPMYSADFAKGFVHVIDETSLKDLLGELDTIQDLTDYLSAKEKLYSSTEVQCVGSEGNLLAFYLMKGRKFPITTSRFLVEDGVWETIRKRPEFIARKDADKISYGWDKLIEFLSREQARIPNGPRLDLNQKELIIRAMAEEPRVVRRGLAKGLAIFLRDRDKVKSRIIMSDRGNIYVLCHFPEHQPEADCVAELIGRSSVSRIKTGDKGKQAIGLGFKSSSVETGLEITCSHLDFEDMSQDDFDEARNLANEMGLYPIDARFESHQEFPDNEGGQAAT